MKTIIGKRKFWLVFIGLVGAFWVTIGTVKVSLIGWQGLDPQLAKLWIGVAKDIALVVLGVYAGQTRQVKEGQKNDTNSAPR